MLNPYQSTLTTIDIQYTTDINTSSKVTYNVLYIKIQHVIKNYCSSFVFYTLWPNGNTQILSLNIAVQCLKLGSAMFYVKL